MGKGSIFWSDDGRGGSQKMGSSTDRVNFLAHFLSGNLLWWEKLGKIGAVQMSIFFFAGNPTGSRLYQHPQGQEGVRKRTCKLAFSEE